MHHHHTVVFIHLFLSPPSTILDTITCSLFNYTVPPEQYLTMSAPLQSRLKQLSTALAQIHPLVSRLRNFTTAVGQGDEARLELGAEIHAHLKETEEQLELLRVEVEALETGTDTRRKGQDNEKELERERVVALAGRLADDLKKYAAHFPP